MPAAFDGGVSRPIKYKDWSYGKLEEISCLEEKSLKL
jgi:hypothetical protein